MRDAFHGKRVFISHASADADFAAWLDRELRAAGFMTWLDVHQLRVGDHLSRKLGAAIEDALAVVAVMSPATANARWMWLELGSAIHRMVTEDNFKVLPALIADVEMPGELRDLVYADFRSDRSVGLAKLVSALHDVSRDDWFYRYRTEQQRAERAVQDVFGAIGSASIGSFVADLDLVDVERPAERATPEWSPPQDPCPVAVALNVNAGTLDGFWLDSLSSTSDAYDARAALITTDGEPPSGLFEPIADGVFVGRERGHRFAHVVVLDEGLSEQEAEHRLRVAQGAITDYIWPP